MRDGERKGKCTTTVALAVGQSAGMRNEMEGCALIQRARRAMHLMLTILVVDI